MLKAALPIIRAFLRAVFSKKISEKYPPQTKNQNTPSIEIPPSERLRLAMPAILFTNVLSHLISQYFEF